MARILFADDDESLRLLYREEFGADGHELLFASTGREAVELARRERPDLIVMDIRMPEMDGLEAMGRIVAEDNEVPVIIYSAFPHHKEDFSSWLADAYLVKSMDLGELKRVIDRKLGERGPA
ncbi:MAG: response regulator [Candidatus Delongbacteria bacterium]